MNKKNPVSLIVGCGRIGNLIAIQLKNKRHQVIGLRRNIQNLITGVEGFGADITEPLPDLPEVDHFIYCPAPQQKSEADYQRLYYEGLQNCINAFTIKPKKSWIISSTRVYSENQGAWVNEQTPLNPSDQKQRVLIEMEQLAQTELSACILRLSGIYDQSSKRLIKWAQQSAYPFAEQHWSNSIHAQDAANAVVHLMRVADSKLYLISDKQPITMQEKIAAICQQLDLPAAQAMQPAQTTGKRIATKKLEASGFQWLYPNATLGYQSITEQHLQLAKLTPFQRKVLQMTQRIPYGKVVSYKMLAELAGSPRSARAVGQTLAINPCAPGIPCHRVISSNRTLHGFSQGTSDDKLLDKVNRLKAEGIQLKKSHALMKYKVPRDYFWQI